MINVIIDDIIHKIANSVQLYVIKNDTFLIHEKNLDFILETIFEYCTNQVHCSFHIDRHSNKKCNVTIFTNDSQTLRMIFKYQETKNNLLINFLFQFKYFISKLSKVIVVLHLESKTIQTSVSKLNKINYVILENKPFKQSYFISLLLGLIYFLYLYIIGLFSRKTIFINNIFNTNLITYNPNINLRANWIMLANLYPTFLWNIQANTKYELTDSEIDIYKDFNFQIYLQNPSYSYTFIDTTLNNKTYADILGYCINDSRIL